ncbi:MAG: 50S ribosomal protein L20 [Luteitalea sp.]|nr:50S ribosomal protein L20 [Luteitalea sp.]
MRVKRGSHRRQTRKKTLSLAKGYFGGKSRLYRYAKEAVERAGRFAYIGRRRKKRDFRRLWVIRINAAARENGLSYGQLIAGLKSANVPLDRKVLADLAVKDPQAFAAVASLAKQAPRAPEASA